jgi:DNA-binding NarL/FixJ family response regulator
MITRRETLNEISTLLAEGMSYAYIAGFLNIALADVKAAVKAWNL